MIDRFAEAIRTGRILVNAPTAVGALGGVYNSMTPTFSLGCGTWGGSMTTDNVNYRNLLNVKTVSRRQAPPQWFRVPSDTYFNAGALESLRELRASQAMLVTDADTEARGVADEVRAPPRRRRRARVLRRRARAERGADPRRRRRCSTSCGPTSIVAVGGGSVIDAAKAMRLFHESPELTLRELTLPFLDARKRVAHYPGDRAHVRLVAVPTTAGTGSEVSPAAVITVGGRKVTLVDYSLVPDMAIVDPRLTLSMPPSADRRHGHRRPHARARGRRVDLRLPVHRRLLRAGDPPDPPRLPRAYADGSRPRGAHGHGERRHDRRASRSRTPSSASTTRSRMPWARASASPTAAPTAIFLPHVLRYNASLPSKFMPAPGLQRLRRAGEVRPGGVGHRPRRRTDEERRERLFAKVEDLLERVEMPRSLEQAGVSRPEFDAALPDLARSAFADPSLRTNPRIPLVRELVALLELGSAAGSPA